MSTCRGPGETAVFSGGKGFGCQICVCIFFTKTEKMLHVGQGAGITSELFSLSKQFLISSCLNMVRSLLRSAEALLLAIHPGKVTLQTQFSMNVNGLECTRSSILGSIFGPSGMGCPKSWGLDGGCRGEWSQKHTPSQSGLPRGPYFRAK